MKDIKNYLKSNYQEVIDWVSSKHERLNLLYDDKPYLYHLDMVAVNVVLFNENPDIVAAAYCHDILEDTDIKYSLVSKFHFRWSW